MTSSHPYAAQANIVLGGQEPFFIVLNTASGRTDSQEVQSRIRAALDNAGRRYELLAVKNPRDLTAAAERAVELARAQNGVVVAAGGDGTLNAVTQVVLGTGLPFGILPQGTFNYFGRTYGIPQETEAAVQCLLDAVVEPVQVGMLNGRAFLVNASVGLYPQLLEDREEYKQRFGRSRLVALWSGLVTLFRAHRQLVLQLEYEGRYRRLRTPTLVVGNNALQLERIGIPQAEELSRNRLVAMISRPVGTLALYGMLLLGMFSRLGDAENVSSFGFDTLVVRLGLGRRRIKVAMDGEITWMRAPLEFRVGPQRLPLLVPRDASLRERA